jgi:hypothetical protein
LPFANVHKSLAAKIHNNLPAGSCNPYATETDHRQILTKRLLFIENQSLGKIAARFISFMKDIRAASRGNLCRRGSVPIAKV